MSLINCPECSNELSDKAYSCPKCGYSRIGERFKGQWRHLWPTIVARAKQVRVAWIYAALCLVTTAVCMLDGMLVEHLAISGEQFGLTNLHTLISYSFVHGGIYHWLVNMLVLALAGLILEARIGGPRTVFVLLAGVIATGMAYALFGSIPMIGSIGAIFALIGGILALWVFHIAALGSIERIVAVLLSMHVLLYLVSGHPGSTWVSTFGFLAGFLLVFLNRNDQSKRNETTAVTTGLTE